MLVACSISVYWTGGCGGGERAKMPDVKIMERRLCNRKVCILILT
jgi:hypothetical protein